MTEAPSQDQFDCQVLAVSGEHVNDVVAVLGEPGTPGLYHLGWALEEARAACRELRKVRCQAIVVPLRYRHPQVDQSTAREIARRHTASLGMLGEEFSPLRDDGGTAMYWSFVVDNCTAQARAMAPGRAAVRID